MNVYEEALPAAIELAEGVSDWRSTTAYRLWRIIVIKRDKCCVICKSGKSRHAHHVDHATYFPEKRFDPENGVCMCSECHENYHNNFHRNTRIKCTRYDFNNFACLSNNLFAIKECQVAEKIVPMIFGASPDATPPTPSTEDLIGLVGYLANDFCIDGEAVMKMRGMA